MNSSLNFKFHPDDVQPVSYIKFEELYQRTVVRDNKIHQLGYNLIIKWETPSEPEIGEIFEIYINPSLFRVIK